MEQIAVSQVDPWADSSSISVTIVISHVGVSIRVLGSRFHFAVEMCWIEDIVIREASLIVMKAPDVQEDCCAFGEVESLDPFVYDIELANKLVDESTTYPLIEREERITEQPGATCVLLLQSLRCMANWNSLTNSGVDLREQQSRFRPEPSSSLPAIPP
jgi:hypothetical protein